MNKELNYDAVAKKLMGCELSDKESKDLERIKEIHENAKALSYGISREELVEYERKQISRQGINNT